MTRLLAYLRTASRLFLLISVRVAGPPTDPYRLWRVT